MREIHFANYARRVGRRGRYNWCEWLVFVDEPAEVLDQIVAVEYRLHESFPDPVRVIEERETRFALQSAGWGEFLIIITVHLADGREVHARYALDLSQPWPADDRVRQ
jgi:transcription initiation factor IIF auxiliary subunit